MGRFRALVSTVDGLKVRSRRGWNMTEALPEALVVVASGVPQRPGLTGGFSGTDNRRARRRQSVTSGTTLGGPRCPVLTCREPAARRF